MFELRTAQKSDESAIVLLGNSIFGPHYMEQLFRIVVDLSKSSVIFFKEKLIGYILIFSQKELGSTFSQKEPNSTFSQKEPGSKKNTSYICSLGVSGEWRRKRIGSILLKVTAKVIKSDIFLHVNVNNRAINLYAQNGYRIVKKVPFYYGRESAYIMVLKRAS